MVFSSMREVTRVADPGRGVLEAVGVVDRPSGGREVELERSDHAAVDICIWHHGGRNG